MPSSQPTASTDPDRFGPALPPRILAGFAIAIVTVVLIAIASYLTLKNRSVTYDRTTVIRGAVSELRALMASLTDAETGQRGFLLTGEDAYLIPYDDAQRAITRHLASLRRQAASEIDRQRLDALEQLTADKSAELRRTIELRRESGLSGALALVRTDRGKSLMDRIREIVEEMDRDLRGVLATREAAWRAAAVKSFVVSGVSAAVLLALILLSAYATAREMRVKAIESWIKAGHAGLARRIQGDMRLETLGDHVLSHLAGLLHAQLGAFYVVDEGGRIRRQAGFALSDASAGRDVFEFGQGLIGQAVKENRVQRVTDLPADYLPVTSALGGARPSHLLIAPVSRYGVVNSVVELGFFHEGHSSDVQLLERCAEAIGVGVHAAKDRVRLEELLEETQRQSEELQAQQEELRVANEELEQQSHQLKESQTLLESQHSELEQSNAQLEEQTSLLENRKDELLKTQASLSAHAEQLARSNLYKSEFLANMSHELRTPLNSSLILAKLLADNKPGNLNEEQVSFARTIFSAGNDLLALINDILDLSKIESGKVEVHPEPVAVARVVDDLNATFGPVAREKALAFTSAVESGVPDRVHTDPQRLVQILRNLLSNAIKFTENGEVALRVYSSSPERVAFEVRDSGIGIPAHQQEVIFEAFRQADGSTHRRYGGTGLGLSIARDLARLLGGDVQVRSASGEGSTFTLELPVRMTVAPVATRDIPASAAPTRLASLPRTRPVATLAPAVVEDDRESLQPDSRVLLIVEDDTTFAAVLRDLARELGFRTVIVHTGADAVLAAQEFHAQAIVLDMHLPDRSGLVVLDELKRLPVTRHIPIHVVSVEDYSQEALSRGAIGYALKPVHREQLVEALNKLESKVLQDLRRVLVVEDDPTQRESIRHLLATEGVEIVAVETAQEALARLESSTFDCMVLDLSLPDLSGYELLEQMAESDAVAFPPVIVYTGRTLTRDEEQRLRRFSRSIIIKDARSPERLLDEVTLFLHQIETALPPERQRMLREARDREAVFEGRRILVVEDDVRNVFALLKVLEPKGAKVEIARNGREALDALARATDGDAVDLVLMDIMMPEMDGLTAMREIRKRPGWKKLPIIALTAKAMKDDQERCLQAGANDYIAKPLDVERLLSLIRVWMPR